MRAIFTAVRSEGALLPPDLLVRIAEGGDLDGLRAEDYHLVGERLNEAVNRAWNRVQTVWRGFRKAAETLPEGDTGVSLTRERWLLPLFQELGFGRLQYQKPVEIGERRYPISHIWERVPIQLLGFRQELDKRGTAKSIPHSLVQEFLNRSDRHLWAILSNGLRLRLLRDNVSFTRQAYVEFDLEAIMAGELYAEFRLLWLVCHQSRFEGDDPRHCWLERWSQQAREQGTRALDQLRDGVERAIAGLGRGFLAHPANTGLREALRSGELDTQEYYRCLLRLVYRLIFLFVAEDRELLLVPQAGETARQRYRDHYSTRRLRRLAGRIAGTRHDDLYQGLLVVMCQLHRDGCLPLALPALGSYLWSSEALGGLAEARLANRDLLGAVRALSLVRQGRQRRAVDYRNLGPEELGSVYESLLELHPEVNREAAQFELVSAAGNERKTTGSYYTPDSLIQSLMDSALEPVLDGAMNAPDPEAAILALKVCDPAVGSGHFLIAAAHRIARRLAAVRSGGEEPPPEATRQALRAVVSHCLYGVDINPMAVELCKVSLWLTAMEPGRPLSFLDHRIQCGNALLGATPALIRRGIPDEAFKPITGDDKHYCSEYKRQNKKERGSTRDLFGHEAQPWERLGNLAAAVAALDTETGDDIHAVHEKQARYETLVSGSDYRYGRLLADAWCAAFVWVKRRDGERPYPITEETFRKIEESPFHCPPWMEQEIRRLAAQYRFFHWHLAFPDVFLPRGAGEEAPGNEHTGWRGGFDVVLGNPPWDKIQPEEEKFFSVICPDIANASSAKIRKALIAELPNDDPDTYALWFNYKQVIDKTCHFLRSSGRLQFTGDGNLNSYRIFTELASALINQYGRAGLIVQTGLATDESGKELFDYLLSNNRIVRFLDFENRGVFFSQIHQQFRFCLLTIQGNGFISSKRPSQFGWLLHDLDEIDMLDRLVYLFSDDLRLFNPSSRTCPVLTSTSELEISRLIYRRGQHIDIDRKNRFERIDFLGELFNMTRDSVLFVREPSKDSMPLYEAKFIHQFDHRFATTNDGVVVDLNELDKKNVSCFIIPKNYVKKENIYDRTRKRAISEKWLFGFRDISSPTNERTVIATVLPFCAVGNNINLILGLTAEQAIFLQANANTFIFDFCARQKISGTHVNIWIFKQLPAIPWHIYFESCAWGGYSQIIKEWLFPRTLELTYTAWDLQPFAEDCGYDGPPFHWDEERRFLLRCELDAAFFHLYLSSPTDWQHEPEALRDAFPTPRDAVAYIMDTFPIVRRKDEKQHGEYRTRRVILEIYDAMQEAMDSGESYRTRLEPGPADSRVAHPRRNESTEI